MAVTKTVLRVNNNRAIVRIIGTTGGDTATITLNSDLVGSGDALTAGGTPTANITTINVSCANHTHINRNGILIATLFDNTVVDSPQFVLNDHNTSDIVVTFQGGAGQILLDITKVSGYSPKFESAQFGGNDNIAVVGS